MRPLSHFAAATTVSQSVCSGMFATVGRWVQVGPEALPPCDPHHPVMGVAHVCQALLRRRLQAEVAAVVGLFVACEGDRVEGVDVAGRPNVRQAGIGPDLAGASSGAPKAVERWL